MGRKPYDEVHVPDYMKEYVRWAYAHSSELNKALTDCCPGTELAQRAWAMLASIGCWTADGFNATARLIQEALLQSDIYKFEGEVTAQGSIYMDLYRAGASVGQLVVAYRNSRPMYFEITRQMYELWMAVRKIKTDRIKGGNV